MMKLSKLEIMKPLDEIKNKLSESLYFLKGIVDVNDFHLILFLLSLQKNSIINIKLLSNKNDLHDGIEQCILDYKGPLASEFNLLYSIIYEKLIRDIDSNIINSIIHLMSSLDQNCLNENFPEIFDDILLKLVKFQGKSAGGEILPLELSRFVFSLSEISFSESIVNTNKPLSKHKLVYNPFAGLASFGISLAPGNVYEGQELNTNIWAVGKLRMMAYKGDAVYFYENMDSIKNWRSYFLDLSDNDIKNDEDMLKFHLILSSPPFGKKFSKPLNGLFGTINNYEHFLIEKGIGSLHDRGKLIAVLSQGFLSRSGSERGLREYLIENDLLELVISIPGGILMKTGLSIAILVINKDKKLKDFVRFLDASKFIISTSAREKGLNYSALNEAVKSVVDSDSLRIVPKAKIIESDFNFISQRYFETEIDIEENTALVKLSELIGSFRGQRITEVQLGKFVRIRNLKETKLDFSLDLKNLEKIELPRHALKISESCLLLATRWSTLKPTYFSFIDEPIFISPDIAAFKVDENFVDINYLINELNTQYVLDQANVFRTGLVISSLRKDDILNIKIKVVKLNEQKAKVKGLLENFAEQKKKELVIFNKIHGLENKILEQNAYLRHSLAGASTNITGAVTSLMNIINEQIKPLVPEVLNFKESPAHTLNLKRLMDILKENADKVFRTTSRVTNNTDPTSEVDFLSSINIYEFLHKYCLEKKAVGSQQYQLVFEFDDKAFKDENGDLMEVYITADKNLLTIMLDNLLQNAEQHAFQGNSNNRIEIALMAQSVGNIIDGVTILISNTGKPMPEGYFVNDFIRNGSTAGFNGGDGYGGWLINRIITFFDGELDIINEQAAEGLPDTDLVTSFEINLPIAEVTIL